MKRQAFTLMELLTVVAVIGVLAAILIPVVGRVRESAHQSQCASNLRQLAGASLLYASDHGGELPRSNHSAARTWSTADRVRNWQSELQVYLGADEPLRGSALQTALERQCRCPSETGRTSGASYAYNVYPELHPDHDEGYPGSPRTWRRLAQIPHPAATVLFAEIEPEETADHLMAHYWGNDISGSSLASNRHSDRANYAFIDGHVDCLPLEAVYNPQENVNRWHP